MIRSINRCTEFTLIYYIRRIKYNFLNKREAEILSGFKSTNGQNNFSLGRRFIKLTSNALRANSLPRRIVANGIVIVNAQGENRGDLWRIEVKENKVSVKPGFSKKSPIADCEKWYKERYECFLNCG